MTKRLFYGEIAVVIAMNAIHLFIYQPIDQIVAQYDVIRPILRYSVRYRRR